MDLDLINQWMHYGLEWIGFGTLVGLIAKAVLPGKDGGGALATVLICVWADTGAGTRASPGNTGRMALLL